MSLNAYLASLRAKHQKLEEELYKLITQSYPDQETVQQIKKEKLMMKDKITQTRTHYHIKQEPKHVSHHVIR